MPALAEPPQPTLSESAVDLLPLASESVGQSMPLRSGALRFTVPSRVSSSQWFRPVLSRLRAAMGLATGWDSYGGAPMSITSVESAVIFLGAVLEPQSAPPTVVPLSDGGVQLLWHQNDLDLEVMLGTVDPEVYVRDLVTHEEFTLDPSSAETLRVLATFVGRLST